MIVRSSMTAAPGRGDRRDAGCDKAGVMPVERFVGTRNKARKGAGGRGGLTGLGTSLSLFTVTSGQQYS